MMIAPDDQRLVKASLAGDTDAFGQLVRLHQDRLYPTLLRLTGSPDDALDLLQDAFLRAFQKLEHFRGQSSFFTWVYRIAVNLALSERRHRKTLPPCASGIESGAYELRAGHDDSDPSVPLEQEEDEQWIQESLQKLPEDARAILVMRDLDGLSYEEIGETLNIPLGTVRSRLHRARCELRSILEQDPERLALRAIPLVREGTRATLR